MQPFALCNDKSFLNFCYALDPKFVLPDRKTVANLLRTEYETMCRGIKGMLELLDSKASFTSDGWTSTAGDPYIVVTCHYIDKEFISIKIN